MRLAVVGAGATGGYLGAMLARSGEEVLLVARGANLAALRARGLTVRSTGGEFTVHPEATDEIAAVAGCDAVFLTLKAHSIAAVAPQLGTALGKDGCLVSAQNGIPWWYFEDRHLDSVDPGGAIARSIPAARVVGCIVYPATRVVEPGVVEHLEGNRLTLGELDGSRSERVQELSALLARAGFKAPVQPRLRNEIWLKLLGNATFNPVSVLTGTTLAEMAGTEAGRELIGSLMEEAAAVAGSLGVEIPLSIEQRLAGAAAGGEHRTSMLQDLEAGRPLEVESLLGAVVELAGSEGMPVPGLQTVLRLTRLLEERRRRS